MEYMYITNRPDIAKICEDAGVERIFVDMEWMGKAERQGHLDSVKSFHTIADIAAVKKALGRARLLARVNPAHAGTPEEVEGAIAAGADMLMLPMARTVTDARRFLSAVNGRVTTVLLLETRDAVQNLDRILDEGFDEVHVGLNDLSLDCGLPFMFTLLANGVVENICERLARRGLPYGFGGVARVGAGRLPAEYILMEHVRLGSTRAILSRSFCNSSGPGVDRDEVARIFATELPRLREAEVMCHAASRRQFQENRHRIKEICACS